jgi:tRNA pseudouridine38-40 synthase
MVGAMVQAGEGKIPPEMFPHFFEGKNGSTAGMTAPAHGLCLEEVFY